MSHTNTIITAFNEHFIDFVNDIITVFPDDTDLLSAKNSFLLIKKANPKMIIKIWKRYVVEKYKSEIDSGDISFFINKDYSTDLLNADNSDKIIEAINRLRNPVKLMNSVDQQKSMKYIQNLKKLSDIYNI
jgi:hypothetical protein